MFIVKENGKQLAFLYKRNVMEREVLNFSNSYQLLHWNGAFWLLKKGDRNVTLALYNGSLRILKRFTNGTQCNNNIFIDWNGKEYLIQFIQGPLRCGLGSEGREQSELYILRGGKLYYLARFEGTAQMDWLQNRWFIIGNGTLYAAENHILRRLGNIRGRTSLVIENGRIWVLSAERLFNVSGLKYRITAYRVETDHLKSVFSENVDGIVSMPQRWKGTPLFVLKNDGYYQLMVLNETAKSFFDVRICKGDYLHVIPNGLALCGHLSRKKAGENEWSVFRIEGNIIKKTAVFRNREWPYIYDKDEIRGFPALNVKNGTFIIISGFAFNTSMAVNLITGERIALPEEIKGRTYKIVQYTNGWVLFTEDKAYLMNNTRFIEITLKERNNTSHISLSGSKRYIQSKWLYALILFVAMLVLILQRRLRR